MVAASSERRRLVVLATVTSALMAMGLMGCVDQFPEAKVERGEIRNAIARGQLTSPKAATVALVSIDGAPAAVEAQFRQSLAADAAAREIAITDIASARYLMRGYLAAYPSDQGVQVAYTYDVFDAGDKRRRQRVSDTIDVPGDGNDPWSAVNQSVLSSLTGRSADDLAVSLAGMPEVQQASAATVVSATPVAGPPPSPVN